MALRNPKVFLAGLRSVYRSHTRNPSVSGTMHGAMRMMEAAGSDTRKNQKVSGPAVRFGEISRRGGSVSPSQTRDYWHSKDRKESYNPNKAWAYQGKK